MLDLNYLLEHLDEVKTNIVNRHMTVDLSNLPELAETRSRLITEGDELRRRANENAQSMKGKMDPEERQKKIEEGRALKGQIAENEVRTKEAQAALDQLLRAIPNMTHPDSPIGLTDEDNKAIIHWGEPKPFDFPTKDHVALGQELDLIDFAAGQKVAGSNFYFLKNDAVLLERGAPGDSRRHRLQSARRGNANLLDREAGSVADRHRRNHARRHVSGRHHE
jgi:seryl-tRNA synthetase